MGELSRQLTRSLQLSRVLVKGDYPLPADMRTRVAGSFGVVREGFVEYPSSHVATILNAVGDQALQIRVDSADQPVPKHLFGLDEANGLYSPAPPEIAHASTYWVGDTVRVHTGTEMGDFNEVDLRIYDVNWILDEQGNW